MAEEVKTEKSETSEAVAAAPAAATDVDNVKMMAALAYLIFFIPLLTHPNNEFGKYHANQGLNLLILAVIINILGIAIPILGWFLILPVSSLLLLVLFIMGVINALNNEKKPLPLIGGFQLIK